MSWCPGPHETAHFDIVAIGSHGENPSVARNKGEGVGVEAEMVDKEQTGEEAT